MRERLKLFVPVFLAAQALMVHWAVGDERPPSPPDLSSFPAEFGEWKKFSEDPVDAEVQGQLHADRLLSRTYVQSPTGSVAGLFVAWFQSQSAGRRQPHSPKVCLPGSGWTPELADGVTLDTAAGTILINRYIVVNHGQRAVVLYWYQTPRRVVAGEWTAKLWLVPDALRDKRTDTALVRVVTWEAGQGDKAATGTAIAFGQHLYPLLREYLPRRE